jgi:DNA-directed RNA polymerase II subunit RPB1
MAELEPTDEIDTRPHKPRIVQIQFGIFSPEEIRRSSVIQIADNASLRPSTLSVGAPANSKKYYSLGINDHRMGTVDRRFACGTCGGDVKECVGHHAYLDLAFPIFHVGLLDVVGKILSVVCYFCCGLLVDPQAVRAKYGPEWDDLSPKHRLQKIMTPKKLVFCPHEGCKGPQPHYSSSDLQINADWKVLVAMLGKVKKSKEIAAFTEEQCQFLKSLHKRPFTSADARSILSGLSDENVRFMGFSPEYSHPKNFIQPVLLIPPSVIRPSIPGSRIQDDLTIKLREIYNANEALKKTILRITNQETSQLQSIDRIANDRAALSDFLSDLQELQYHAATLINNEIRGQKTDRQRSGAPIKSLTTRLKGKEGRFRWNLMGKRVDWSARSVISPDPNIDIDEVGVPYEVAKTLTFPERVTRYNIAELTERIRRGPDHIDGAKQIIRKSGRKIDLSHVDHRARIQINYGDVVERFMKDGEDVVFNRQPSLHKQSMMSHRVRRMPGLTFRLNLAAVTPYNADFDGDEMNLHLLQSYEAKAEQRELMAVNRQILSAKSSKPCMGLVQDAVLASYYLSRRDVFFDRAGFFQLICQCRYEVPLDRIPPPAILKPRPLWTGKQIFGCLFPPDLYYKRWRQEADIDEESKHHDPKDNLVVVRGGELLSGRLCKETLGMASGGIIHAVCRSTVGLDGTGRLLSDLQRVVNYYIMTRGFSIGISDNIIPTDLQQSIDDMIDTLMRKVSTIYEEMMDKEGYTHKELEPHVFGMLRKALGKSAGIVDSRLNDKNAIYGMVHSGSKGNPVNISQMVATVGQQSVDGKRIWGKPLPCFARNDRHPASHGFVQRSLFRGLRVHEFFFHAMGGREGLVDTSVKSVGYHTPLVIRDAYGQFRRVKIGAWIDELLDSNKSRTHRQPEQKNSEWLDLYNDIYVPTVTSTGNVFWGKVSSVTRHDPTDYIYEIKTQSGRSVTVAESKSLLVWNPETQTLQEVHTTRVKVGDLLPVTRNLPSFHRDPRECNDRDVYTKEHGRQAGIRLARKNEEHYRRIDSNSARSAQRVCRGPSGRLLFNRRLRLDTRVYTREGFDRSGGNRCHDVKYAGNILPLYTRSGNFHLRALGAEIP